MLAEIKVKKTVEIRSVKIDISPRYIGDSDDDDLETNFPLLNDEKLSWIAEVNIDTGQIAGWPIGENREMSVKVCDAGTYSLIDASGEIVAIKEGYVPNGVVPGEYGDYVDLKIDENGMITNWPNSPDISEFFEDDD